MKKSFKVLLPVAAALALTACSSSEITRFATTDMTWAEFYAAEIGAPASKMEQMGYDAVTSATMSKSKRFTSNVVSEDGSTISGIKAVPVGMTESVYKKLSDDQKSRYTFIEGEPLESYKVLDKKGAFGRLICQVVDYADATAKIQSGQSSTWGNYTISVQGAELDGDCMGVILTCSDGTKVGLKALDNIWIRKSELGISVAEFTEPHGNKPTYKHTEVLEGKTITNITYLFNGADAVSIDTDLLVKKLCGAKVTVEGSLEGNSSVKAVVSNLPDGYTVASVRKGLGRGARALQAGEFTYSNGNLSITCDDAKDMYSITFQSDEYSDLTSSIDLTK